LNTQTVNTYQAEKRDLFHRTSHEEKIISVLGEKIIQEKLQYAKDLNALSVAYCANRAPAGVQQ